MKKQILILISIIGTASLFFVGFRYSDRIFSKFNSQMYNSKTMPAIYMELLSKADPMKVYELSDEHILILEPQLKKDPNNKSLQFKLAAEYLFNNQSQIAIDIFESLEKDQDFLASSKSIRKEGKISRFDSLKMLLALAYLRLGEQENCISNHNGQSCVFPISGSGIHELKDPSKEAIRRYLDLVNNNPNDHLSQWLLNIAMQAYGNVPPEIPKELVINKALIKSEYDFKPFRDVAMQAGVTNMGLAGGVCADDFDNDGYIDIISSSIGPRDQIRYFHNNADGTFADWTSKAGLIGEYSGLNIVEADYNNDGNNDFMILRGAWKGKYGRYPLSLLRNNGDGTFSDVTIEAGLLRNFPTQTADWADINQDGWLDLFIGNENYPCELFLSNKNGTFTNITKSSRIKVKSYVKGVAFGDYNNDGLPDLYISNLGKPNLLYKNNGPNKEGEITFEEVGKKAGVDLPLFSFPCWWFDYNNDGWQDLFVSAYRLKSAISAANEYLGLPQDSAMMPCLYQNNGNGTFTNVTEKSNLNHNFFTMGCSYGDLDNDGWLDFYLGVGAPDLRIIVPNRMFRNNEGKNFQDVTFSAGVGQLQKGHAVAIADFDMDGDQDIYADFGGFFSGDVYQNALYENSGNKNNYLYLKFEGTLANRSAMGARIKLQFSENGISRTNYHFISKGTSFGGNPIMLQAGVGKAKVIDEIEITWPIANSKQIFKDVAANQILLCKQGTKELTPIKVSSFQFKTMDSKMLNSDSTKVAVMNHMKM